MLRALVTRTISAVSRLPKAAAWREPHLPEKLLPIAAFVPPHAHQLPLVQQVRYRFYPKVKGALNDALIPDRLLEAMHNYGPPPPRRKRRCPIDNKPFMKGVVIKTVIKKPKKPNSANRKCVYVRLSNGRETYAHVPGIGHNLQEHSVVLVRKGRTKDVPGLKLKVVRGKYDCSHVIKKTQS